MNKLYLFLVLLVVVGGGYYLMAQKQVSPVENTMPLPETTGVVEKQAVRSLTLDSSEFSFSVKEIQVKQGETVEITLTNSGKMPHDFVLDEFIGAKTTQIKNGETDTITFVAVTAGTFEYYCSVGQHRKNGMVGKLIVE